MRFDSWMRKTGLSESSVLKYLGAIEGVLSEWALDAGIISGSILDIKNTNKFDSAVINIQQIPIFQERNDTGHNMYSSALNKYSEYLSEGAISTIEDDIEEIISDSNLGETEKDRLVSSRLGQGKFRKELKDYWQQCAVTGYKNFSMLIASHIKPWSQSSNSERLDKYNGLLLSPNLDKAFDQGHISFTDVGKIIISPSFRDHEQLSITTDMDIQLSTKHKQYMEYHREHVYNNT